MLFLFGTAVSEWRSTENILAQCPFCHAPVSESIVRHGGTCPACLHVIPGEEAPTHPGDEVMAEIRKADEAHQRKRADKPLKFGLPLFVVALLGVGYALKPEPPLEKLEFGADEFGFKFDAAEFKEADPNAVAPAEAPVANAGKPGGQASKPRPGGGLAGAGNVGEGLGSGPAVPSGDLSQGGSADPSAPVSHRVETEQGSAVREAGGLAGAGSASGSSAPSSLDVAFNARRTAAVLESRDDIQAAIKDMLRARVPRLKQCYERSLKSNEDLHGSWRMSFMLGKEGAVQGATAEGQTMHDATFESCLVNELSAWTILGQLKREFGPVGFPVQFGAE